MPPLRMAISTNDFWRLLEDSGLHSAVGCQDLARRFAQVKGAAQQGNAAALAEWLVAQRALTRYQAKILLGGRAGPFVYGAYQLHDRVSEGRFVGCFKAVHTLTRHPVVLWFLTGPILESPQAYALAASQVAIACRAVHPCLVHTYQLVDLGRFKFIVCEDPAGTTADEALRARGRLTVPQACRVMWQVAAGTAALHALGAAHGEIRPSNVWIDTQGNGRLLQVPFSREPHLPPTTPHIVPTGDADRAADHFAPELAIAGQAPDALTDVYALGCTLYELLSGQAPFTGGDVAAKMRRHATEAIQPLDPLGVPTQLAQVVSYAMAKDRRLRYPTSAQLAQALAYFVDPAQKGVLPQPAATYAEFEAWRRTQPLVPSMASNPLTHSPAPPAARDASAPWNAAGASMARAAVADGVATPVPPSSPPPAAATNVDPAVSIVDAGHERTASVILHRRKKHTRNNAIISMAAVLLLAMLGAVGFGIYSRDNTPETALETNGDAHSDGADRSAEQEDGGRQNHEVAEQTNEAAANGSANTIPDDGKTLWASPTSGPTIAWAYLPPRAEIALALRPAELLRHPEGEKLLAALGPWGARARSAADEILGRPLAEFEQLTVAWTKTGDGWAVAFAARPADPTAVEALTARWQSFQQVSAGAEKYYVSQGRAYFAPAAEQGKLFVVAPVDTMSEITATPPNNLPLSREMAKLMQTSDSQRLATLLFTRGALVVDAQPSLASNGLGRLHDALSWLVPDDANGAALSLHMDQNCYLEARIVASVETTQPALTTTFQEKMKGLPNDVEALLSQIDLHPYGKTVLFRLDDMTRFLQNQLRVDADGDQVVINAYLPAVAAHNLALAAELTIVQPGADEPPQPISTPEPAKLQPGTVAEKLKKSITFVQQRDTLEKAAQALSAEIGVPIEVLGLEFQPEGINRNNLFTFEARDQPADEVLRSVLLAANPDGKLVYVIKSKDNGGPEAIVITTRAAAARRGDALPPEPAAAPGKAITPSKKK